VFTISNTLPSFSIPIDRSFRLLGRGSFSLRFSLPKHRRHHEYSEIQRKMSVDLHKRTKPPTRFSARQMPRFFSPGLSGTSLVKAFPHGSRKEWTNLD
jgi:hypothetical protein